MTTLCCYKRVHRRRAKAFAAALSDADGVAIHARQVDAAATGIVTASLLTAPIWAAQSALAAPRAATRVPCSASALSTAISTASSGGTLALAAGCRYRLTAPLPAITRNLTIRGNDATIAPSASASPAGFPS